jgi:putative tryptophan/tyrosine transport system substrate-binding protein
MDRRSFVLATVGGLLAAPLAAEAQPGPVKIGYLSNSADVTNLDAAFLEALQELGYGPDRIVARYSAGRDEVVPTLAAELLRSGVHVLATWGPGAIVALRNETDKKIPIVFLDLADPVGRGFITSLSHPGGNLTGLAANVEDYNVKRLELLKQAVPNAKRVGIFLNETTMKMANRLESARAELTGAARALQVDLRWFSVKNERDLPQAFVDMGAGGLEGVVVLGDYSVFWVHRKAIADNFLSLRLPTLLALREAVVVGGLMSYGPNLTYSARRGAWYVDKILKGAKPADLPVEQATKVELVINVKTAKALGLTIPQSLLLRADQVIE